LLLSRQRMLTGTWQWLKSHVHTSGDLRFHDGKRS
jgi:hypothetical protein